MPELTIIADDLTGAADCGIAFALAGLPTFVAFGKGPPPGDAQVLGLDTGSRSASPGRKRGDDPWSSQPPRSLRSAARPVAAGCSWMASCWSAPKSGASRG